MHFKLSDRKLEEFETYVADFIEAWECVRESIETYGMCTFICMHGKLLRNDKHCFAWDRIV